MSDHFRKLERMYLSANINRLLFPNTDVLIKEGSAEISLEVTTDYFHALHAMHGAVYFKLMDDAAYFAANSLVTDYMLLTAQFDIRFLRPVFEGKIKAVGTYIGDEGRFFKAQASLFDEEENEVARGLGLFAKSKTKLSPAIGYA
jgi:uncharacterized protein (TIGR00369 family)